MSQIVEPSGIPLSGDGSETISCSIKALTVPVTITVQYEIVLPNGQATYGSFLVTATISRTGARAESVGTLPRGVLVSACIDAATAFPTLPGALHVQCSLKRSGSTVAQLFAGYAHRTFQPSFPNTRQVPSADYYSYPGNLLTQSGTAPAVASEIADVVPASAFWRLFAAEVVLVTDANAANRLVNLFIDDGSGGTITRQLLLTDTTAQTATLTRTHGWYSGTDNVNTASVSITDGAITLLAKFPMSLQKGILLPPSSKIRTITTNIQVGDQYGAARYIVEEYLA